MGPRFALLLAALADCLLPGICCIYCNPGVVKALKSLEQDYLPSHLDEKHRKVLMKMIEDAVKDFKDLPYHEETFMGAIGEGRAERQLLGPGMGVEGLGTGLFPPGMTGAGDSSQKFKNGAGWNADFSVPQLYWDLNLELHLGKA
jgi:hypothetical protein